MKYEIGNIVWIKISKLDCRKMLGIIDTSVCGYEGPGKVIELAPHDSSVIGLEYRVKFPLYIDGQQSWWINKENIMEQL